MQARQPHVELTGRGCRAADVAEVPLATAPRRGRRPGAVPEVLVLDISALGILDCAGLRVLLEVHAPRRMHGTSSWSAPPVALAAAWPDRRGHPPAPGGRGARRP